VLRAHGALHSLHFAAEKGLTDEVAAGIAAGLDTNARDQVIFLCVCGCVEVGSLVCKSCIYLIYISETAQRTCILHVLGLARIHKYIYALLRRAVI
jgi:hypothetical protein